jgi:DNA polymerase-3 subunit alpha
MSDFVHLHTHSEYSLLDGLGKLDHLIERAKSYGMNALAVTDHGAMYGAFKFYLKAKAAGIKPIIGVETYVARRTRFDKEAKLDTDPYHLVLIAENNTGYKNLLKLVTTAHLEGFYYKPRVDWQLLQQYHEGLICLSACLQGQVPQLLRDNQDTEAEETAKNYAALFGPDHYYLELQRHPHIPDCDAVNEKLVFMAKKLGLPIVATNDIHYVDAQDAEAQEILLCVQTQETMRNSNRKMTMIDSPDFYMRSGEEMKGLFIQYPEAIENTARIAAMCDVSLSVGKWILPSYPLERDDTPEEHLTRLVNDRVGLRYGDVTKEVKDRIAYELDIINSRGYATYFLIVGDFVNWAKSEGIAVGPGRGSAAGSVVSYVLGITGIDPFFFKLPFERFLNPFRPSPPDIDLDFADDRRDEVIAYVTRRYGEDKVAQIITFGTMEARGAVRDAGRALGMAYAGPDRISKMIPLGFQGNAMTIDKAIAQSAELARAYETEPETRRLLDVARKLEGVARHASVHAAGVVISDKPIVEYTPLQRESKGERIITQYDMYTVGDDGVGLLKMDFLGLRNLTILSQALAFIRQTRQIVIDMAAIPLDDRKTYAMLGDGETTGIFQLESAGMRRSIKELKPTSIFDLMAMVALYRPGPIAVIPEFIKRKHDPSQVSYPDARLADVLAQSYGLICYQDDVLLTAITLAGYSWGDADKLRKAVGKKIASEMKKQKEKFVQGCVKNGLSQKKSEDIFTLIEPFAGYGFNKAHAACYAMIAYQTAYLKANYTVEYMTAVLTAESRANTGPARDEKISMIVEECRRMNIPLLSPDINASDIEFTIEGGAIRFGFTAIKNVGTAAIDVLLESRRSGGAYAGLANLVQRVDTSKVTKKTFECLIKSGALDAFGKRSQLLSVVADLLNQAHKVKRAELAGQSGLFDDYADSAQGNGIKDTLPDMEELPKAKLLSYEKELLGFYLTEHPLESLAPKLRDMGVSPLSDVTSDRVGDRVKVGGIIVSVKQITTKAGNHEMAFVRLQDTGGSIEIVVFPKVFARTADVWLKDTVVVITGRADEKEDHMTILADDVLRIS